MVMAAYLIEFERFDAKKAMEEVIAIRPIAFSAEGWLEFGLQVLSHFKTHNQGLKSTSLPLGDLARR